MLINKFNVILLLQITACCILLGSFSLELFFGVLVCSLCIIQRMLWVSLLLNSILIRYLKVLIPLIMLANIGVASYQMLLQYNIVTSSCPIDFDNSNISCSAIDFKILGLPLSFYNIIINLLLLIIYKKTSALITNTKASNIKKLYKK